MPRVTSRCGPALAAIAFAAALCTATVAPALPSAAKITTAGLGPVKIGMTVSQVEVANKRDVIFEGGDADAECALATLGTDVFGLFSEGRLARIYVGSRLYRTRTAIRVGDPQSKVVARYGRALRREPHKYVPGGFYFKLTVGNRRLVFDTDGKRVKQISTGRKPEIDYVEGCA